MQGAGMVRDLREAATLDASLVAMTNGLAGLTRSQMLSALDGLLTTWAGTSGMKTSIQDATSQGYLLKYLAPGMSNSDILTVLGLDGGGGTGGEPTPAEQARRAGLIAQMTHISQLIGVLERFNGTPFVTVGSTSVTTGTGAVIAEQTTPPNQTTGETSHYVFVPLNAGQLALLEQSYAQLKESVYGGLVMQTRLKPYLDAVTLSVDEGGVRLDFSAMEAANDFEWRVAA